MGERDPQAGLGAAGEPASQGGLQNGQIQAGALQGQGREWREWGGAQPGLLLPREASRRGYYHPHG